MSSSACQPLEPAPAYPVVTQAATRDPALGAGYEAFKRATDLAGSAALLAFLVPLLLAIAACIKLTGPGPVVFTQRRLGRDRRVFLCYKFRTMVPDVEARLAACDDLAARFDRNFKLKDDPRVTPLGALLRRTSLDELPQLWNVLRGDMSLIGPRPVVEPELARYGRHAGRLLTVKPGLGGVWQVNGRSETSYEERVAMDMSYIDSRSMALDLKLLFRTALVVLGGRGAY